ncbi:MAG: FAD:protein FMN transferase [Clostridiales bacterium]|nr:FAD:protein FMN transferase [Candidatus Cacconaster stercorequi]
MKRFFSVLLTIFMLLSLTACGEPKPVEQSIFAMDTYMTLVAYGDNAQDALDDCARAINDLERTLSRTISSSCVARLNADGSFADEETARLVDRALHYSTETGGTFDITIAPLVELWNITGDDPHVPAKREIDALLPLVGSDHVHVKNSTVTLDEGCSIDLGGIAKGYASDVVADIFRCRGIESGTVSLGGNVYVCGTKPGGEAWTVGIQNPNGGDCAAYVSLTNTFAVTSGGYQRYFTAEDGTVYQHIIDPHTGAPARSDLTSVTVICPNGTCADAYSTALYVMGEQGAIDFWRSHGDFDMILITADGRLLYTPALTVTKPEGSNYDFQTIS